MFPRHQTAGQISISVEASSLDYSVAKIPNHRDFLSHILSLGGEAPNTSHSTTPQFHDGRPTPLPTCLNDRDGLEAILHNLPVGLAINITRKKPRVKCKGDGRYGTHQLPTDVHHHTLLFFSFLFFPSLLDLALTNWPG